MIGGGHGAVDCKIKESGGNGIAYMVGAVAAAGTAAGGASPLHAGDGAAGGEQEQNACHKGKNDSLSHNYNTSI